MKRLPPTGTAGLLERLSPYIPDELINALVLPHAGSGRRPYFSAAQLFRVNLLALLTPVHSFNLLVRLLLENRAWRTFARLRNRLRVPDVRMLHEFRCQLNLAQLRRVNESLLLPLIEGTAGFPKTVALIDSTDLPAAANAYKKTRWASIVRSGRGLAAAAAKTAIAVILSATKSTRSACGCVSMSRRYCWPH